MSHNAPQFEITPPPAGSRFAIVCSRWNGEITDRLLEGSRRILEEAGVAARDVTVVRVPGAFELPVMANHLAKSGDYAGVICLGVVIQGDTDHDKYINTSVAHAIQTVALNTGRPVSFGLLTCRTQDQARERAGGSAGHKGEEAALAAIEMVRLMHTLSEGVREPPGQGTL